MKTALVTGGSRGIGRACVEELTRRGWQVAFGCCAHAAEAKALAEATGALALAADLADREAADGMVKAAIAAFGHLDLLVNNAAVASQGLTQDVRPDEWDRLVAVNLTAPFVCIQAALPSMLKRQSGCIINVSSVWGVHGASCEVPYSATKAALIGMTRALAKEVGPSGIRVNAVAPGVIDTDMNRHLSQEDLGALAEETPLGRLGSPAEVARTIAFLASEDAAFITGQVLGVDGGFAL